MIKPSLDELMKRVDSRYTLVVVSAKIARKLTEGQTDNGNNKANPVSLALKEVAEGRVAWERTKSGIK